MGAAGVVCTVTYAGVLTKDNIGKSGEHRSECFGVEYFLLEIAKDNKIHSLVFSTEGDSISHIYIS